MCGIAGIAYRECGRPVDPAVLKAMGDVIAHRGVLEKGTAFIQKPFTVQGLASKVREVLENS